jgi:tRNA A37 N6-isopentenylltransferase MiaA
LTKKKLIKVSEFEKFKSLELDYDFRNVVITMDRFELMFKIEERCEKIIENGLFEETAFLMELGFHESLNFAGIGYKHAILLLKEEEELTLKRFSNFLVEFKGSSRKYCRKQLSWFRNQDLTLWKLNEGSVVNDLVNMMQMTPKEYLESCRSEENHTIQEMSHNWLPKEIEEKRKFYKSLDQLYLYKNKEILKERVQKINFLKQNLKK